MSQKSSWLRFLGIADATSGRGTGHALSPAFRVTVPIFHRNDGLILRTEAELEKSVRQKQTVENQIIFDVRQAHTRYVQARTESQLLEQQLLPQVALANWARSLATSKRA